MKVYNASSEEIGLNTTNSLKKLNAKGFKFVACNNALKAFNMKKEDINSFVDIVPAGVLELVEKMEGYSYIKP